jgi:hypothetical protein
VHAAPECSISLITSELYLAMQYLPVHTHALTRLLARSVTHRSRPARSEFSFELAAASGGFKKVTERRAHKIFSALVNRAGGGGGVVSNKRNGSTTLLFIRGARASAASSGCMQERPRPGAYTAMRAHTYVNTWGGGGRERIYNSDAAKHSKIAIRPAQHLKNVSPPRRALSTMLFA